MFGGISVRGKVLVLADAAGDGEVFVFDLETRRLAGRFSFGVAAGWSDAGGIALAEDSSLFIPDTKNGCVRRFSLFGNDAGVLGRPTGAIARDRRGLLAHPRAVCFDRRERLWVTCGDRAWVHGLQVFGKDGRFVLSAHAFGQRRRTFGPALGLCAFGEQIFVADTGNDCVQCFRDDGTFLGAHDLPANYGRPMAIAAWQQGFAVIVSEPTAKVLRFDRHFKLCGELRLPPEITLVAPSALTYIASDDLLVLDRDAERVLSFDARGHFAECLFDTQEW